MLRVFDFAGVVQADIAITTQYRVVLARLSSCELTQVSSASFQGFPYVNDDLILHYNFD